MPNVNPVPSQQPTATVAPRKPINWRLIGIIAVTAAIVIGGLGYAAVVLNVFGTKVEEPTTTTKQATPSSTPKEAVVKDKIAFVKDGKIIIANTDGSNRQEIGEGSSPQWCPDASKLAFRRVKKANTTGFIEKAYAEGGAPMENYYYDFKSKKVIQLTTTTSNEQIGDGAITWAQDCNRYAYFTFDGKLTVGNIKTGQTTIILTEKDGYRPVWSQNGDKVLFTRPDPPLDSMILTVVSPDGSNKKLIKVGDMGLSSTGIFGAIWGNSANELIVEVAKLYPPPNGTPVSPDRKVDFRVYKMLINDPTNLKEIPTTKEPSHIYRFPLLSPNGKLIAVTKQSNDYSSSGMPANIYQILNYDGQILNEDVTKVPNTDSNLVFSSMLWSPTSEVLLISTNTSSVVVVGADGQKKLILEQGISNIVWSPK